VIEKKKAGQNSDVAKGATTGDERKRGEKSEKKEKGTMPEEAWDAVRSQRGARKLKGEFCRTARERNSRQSEKRRQSRRGKRKAERKS